MINKIFRGLIGLVVSISGCAGKVPSDIYVSSVNPFFIPIDTGVLHSERIYDTKGNEIGLRIEKEHFLFGKVGEQELYLPEEARNIGWNFRRELLGIKFYAGFDLEERRRVAEFTLTENATGSKRKDVRRVGD